MRTVKCPPRIGKLPVVGPAWKADFGNLQRSVQLGLQLAMDGHHFSATKALDAAFGNWCDTAERELESNVGESMS